MEIYKQSVGIDIAKDTFTACVCKCDNLNNLTFSEVNEFKNGKTGFNKFLKWTRKSCDKQIEVVFLMEATGVYYENLAYHLNHLKRNVSVVLPNKSRHYFLSLNIKSKTDEIDATVLSQFGVERKHREWIPPKPIFRKLRNLTRFNVQLKEQKTAISNILHSQKNSHEVQNSIIKSAESVISSLKKQIVKCENEIESLINSDKEISEKVRKVISMKGVGIMTVATVIAETNGFEGFSSSKQVISYAGYDVIRRESGSSIKGKTKISKKGNRYIRRALHFPALSCSIHNDKFKNQYERIYNRRKIKMVAFVALQRKILVVLYALWRDNSEFEIDYIANSNQGIKVENHI